MTTTSARTIPQGRIETITSEEELRLKELWAYILNFWGRPAKIPTSSEGKKLLRASCTLGNEYEDATIDSAASGAAAATADATSSTTAKEKKSGGKFSKFKLGKKKTKETSATATASPAVSQNGTFGHKRVGSLSESIKQIPSKVEIEGRYTDEMVHGALKDLKPDEMYENFWSFLRLDSPDNLVLRFLRARKWDVDKSLAMISNTLHWRIKDSQIDRHLREGELKLWEEYINSDKTNNAGVFKNYELNKSYIRGFDKQGRPIVVVRPRLHHSSDQTIEEMQLYTLMVIETARLFLKEPVDSASILFDMSDFSLSNMDYSPVKFMISAFEAHYPESLGVLLIHKAPWVFSGIWNIIKNWLDPVVASKVNFTKNTSDLEKFIEAENLPASLGGKDDFEPTYIEPKEGENDLVINDSPEKTQLIKEREEIIENFIVTTLKWIEADDSAESAGFLEQRIKIGKQLNDNYIKLDPYIRGRSNFDRLGLINFC
ncbi:Csr1 protein [Saccharomycopsis crataegensis]|uniref:Csr1 protein n=1 Tax=Saccharomycopsis crataegensis TaxID=43959 RepID=A0AAV5QM39_9ASCO|nr:Csr1 protein [Saccharomycopsis crataegensis]